ncbi:TIGR00730 family Rossman fold protein, partial [Mesorhizobium sp.]
MNTIRSICVYCGSSPGRDETYAKAGHLLGRSIAKSGLRLIYGGGTKGIMGAVAEGAMRAGGKVTGIIPRFLINKEATETALDRLDELVITENMHERKHTMFEKSDAFVALPGGIGTVEEIIEIMTWGQLGH